MPAGRWLAQLARGAWLARGAAAVLLVIVAPLGMAFSARAVEPWTDASAQAGRFPTTAQLRCSDAQCGAGLLMDPMFTAMEFRDSQIIGGGVFALAPGYLNKVSAFWSDVSTRQSVAGGVGLSINLALFTTLSKAKDAVVADAAKEGLRLARISDAGLAGRWLADLTAPDGTRLRYAYVVTQSPEPTVIRGVCALWGTSRRSPTCGSINLLTTISEIALRAPTPVMPSEVAIPPTGLRPVLVMQVYGSGAWAAESPHDALLVAMADTTTTVVQYTPSGQPRMAVYQRTVNLPASTDVRAFVDAPCEPELPGTLCRSEALPEGMLRTISLKESPRKVVQVQIRRFSDDRLSVVECSRPADFAALTAIQLRICRTLGEQLG